MIFFLIAGSLLILLNRPPIFYIDKYFENEKFNEDNTEEIVTSLINSLSKRDLDRLNYNKNDYPSYAVKLQYIEKFINGKDGLLLYLDKGNASYLIAYERGMLKYSSLGIVDDFAKIKDIDIMPLKSKNTNLIVVREEIDQRLGAFEAGTYIRAYFFHKKFNLVLSIMEEYEAYYNELWENKKEDNRWKKITYDSLIEWNNEINPIITVLQTQISYISRTSNTNEIPSNNNFNIVGIQEFKNTYLWSDEWRHFILGEAILKNGDEIAIIEDMEIQVFDFKGESFFIKDKYRVKNKKNEIFVVNKNDVVFGASKEDIRFIK